jgi:hypothetical protein
MQPSVPIGEQEEQYCHDGKKDQELNGVKQHALRFMGDSDILLK